MRPTITLQSTFSYSAIFVCSEVHDGGKKAADDPVETSSGLLRTIPV